MCFECCLYVVVLGAVCLLGVIVFVDWCLLFIDSAFMRSFVARVLVCLFACWCAMMWFAGVLMLLTVLALECGLAGLIVCVSLLICLLLIVCYLGWFEFD